MDDRPEKCLCKTITSNLWLTFRLCDFCHYRSNQWNSRWTFSTVTMFAATKLASPVLNSRCAASTIPRWNLGNRRITKRKWKRCRRSKSSSIDCPNHVNWINLVSILFFFSIPIRLFDWRPEKMRGERAKHEKTVIIKNLFEPELFDREVHLILDYQNDLRDECGKCGTVRKVVVYDVSLVKNFVSGIFDAGLGNVTAFFQPCFSNHQ